MHAAVSHAGIRSRSAALSVFVFWMFVAGFPLGAQGQESEPSTTQVAATPAASEKLPVEDFSKPMGPADPFNRGTPRGSMWGFLASCRKGDYDRAAEYLDLRSLPPEEQQQGPQIARQLKAVLDQKLWVDVAHLSDRNDGFADDGLPNWQDRLGDIQSESGLVTLLLQRVPREGDNVRIWKVSSVTVARTAELYEEFGTGRLKELLPPIFFEFQLLGLALWQWTGLLLLPIAGVLISLLLAGSTIRLLGHLVTRRGRALDERIVAVVRGPVRLALTVLVFAVGRSYLRLELPVQNFLLALERLVWVVAVAWLVFRLIDIVIVALRGRAEQRGNLGIVPVLVPGALFTKVVVLFVGGLGVLSSLGVNVTAAIAGLGVGGIAVALAAQKTIENLFGGVSIFADRPVRVGDFVRYGEKVGTVEEIGLRSTRVRTLDRTVVSIPNSTFSNMELENYALRDRMRLWTIIGVRYETTPDQLRYLLTQLRQILLSHPRITEDPARARLIGFGAYSLDIEIFAYADTNDWSEFLGIREDVYLLFMDAVKEAGTGFAFPSSTTYVGRDDGLDPEEARRAEARVAEWRQKNQLPFPNIPEDRRSEIWNTREWPPPGSPNAKDD